MLGKSKNNISVGGQSTSKSTINSMMGGGMMSSKVNNYLTIDVSGNQPSGGLNTTSAASTMQTLISGGA
jgi:hypothetical protein